MNYLKRKYMALMRGVNFRGYLRKASGYPLTLADCANSNIVSLFVAGNSVQDGTPTPDVPVEVVGVGDKTSNLFDISQVSGDSITLKDNKLYMNDYINTTNITPEMFLAMTGLKEGDKFTTHRQFEIADGSPVPISTGKICFSSKSGSLLVINGAAITRRTIPQGFTSENYHNMDLYGISDQLTIMSQLQVVRGLYVPTTLPEYEPYGYRVPIECGGRNLFDINKVITDGAVSNNGIIAKDIDFFLAAGTYTLQLTANTSCSVWLRKGQVGTGYFSQLSLIADVPRVASFTFDSDMYLRISTFAGNVTIYDIQILEGTYTAETMPPYEPYHHDTVNIYTDKPLYGVNGVPYEEKVLTGNEGWSKFKELTNTYTFISRLGYSDWVYDKTYSNYFPRSGSIAYDKEGFMSGDTSPRVYFCINKDRLNSEFTLDAWKAWLKEKYDSGNPVKMYFKKQTETQPQLNGHLHLQKGTNILTSTATVEPTGMTAEYYSSKEV